MTSGQWIIVAVCTGFLGANALVAALNIVVDIDRMRKGRR